MRMLEGSAFRVNCRVVFFATIVIMCVLVLFTFFTRGCNDSSEISVHQNQNPVGRLLGFQTVKKMQQSETGVYMIPDDKTLETLDNVGLLKVYWKYINTLQVLCRNQTRLGVLEDNGKEVCIDEKYVLRRPCLVYSFGSHFDFDFELDINKHYGCEVHTFDPSADPKDQAMPYELRFHTIGLSGDNFINKDGWQMKTLSTIMKMLKHEGRVIDLLKIDIEGSEWDALPDMVNTGIFSQVKQLCMEVHYTDHIENKRHILKILRQLYDQGLRIFMHEHNIYSKSKFPDPVGAITTCNEISLININL